MPWIGRLNSQLTWAPGTAVGPNTEVLSPHTAKARSLLFLFDRNGGRRARAGGLLELKWLEECCKPGVSSDSAWHTAPTDISLRAVTTRAIRMAYGTALSKVCVILIFANIRAGWVRSTGSPIFASIRAGWVRSTGLLPPLDPKA